MHGKIDDSLCRCDYCGNYDDDDEIQKVEQDTNVANYGPLDPMIMSNDNYGRSTKKDSNTATLQSSFTQYKHIKTTIIIICHAAHTLTKPH
jgi:hypothetical protein